MCIRDRVGVEQLVDNYRQFIDECVNTSRRRSVHVQHGESLARGDGQLERLYIEGRRSFLLFLEDILLDCFWHH